MTEKEAWKPTVCIYHGGCIDGFTAAWVVWRKWGDDVRYVPMGHGDALPELTHDDHVLMVDFSLKRDALSLLSARVASLVVIDHHKTAADELSRIVVDQDRAEMSSLGVAELIRLTGQNAWAFFDMEKSGARMAWEFCFGCDEFAHPLVRRVEDRDLWRFSLGDTQVVHAYLASLDQTFPVWERVADDYAREVYRNSPTMAETIGGRLLAAHRKNVDAMLVNAHERIIGGHRVPCVNVPYWMASDTGHALLKKYPDAPFAATFYIRGDGQRAYSLRSDDSRVDVSEVAKKFGGGGHRNAAGFAVPE